MIYFIQAATGEIKIGYSVKGIWTRIKTFQTASPVSLTVLHEAEGTFRLEQQLHEKFKHLNIRGEWYRPDQELLDFIESAKLLPKDARLMAAGRPGRIKARAAQERIRCEHCAAVMMLYCPDCTNIRPIRASERHSQIAQKISSTKSST